MNSEELPEANLRALKEKSPRLGPKRSALMEGKQGVVWMCTHACHAHCTLVRGYDPHIDAL